MRILSGAVFVLVVAVGFSAEAKKPHKKAKEAVKKPAVEKKEEAEPEANAAADASADASANQGPKLPWVVGPKAIDLGQSIKLDLPAGYQFLGQPEASAVMTKMGNLNNEGLLGIATSIKDDEQYLVTFRYSDEGYIKDDEELDADDLLDAMREGEEEYNAERQKAGFTPLHLEGWDEAPHYDKAKHQLVWGLIVADAEGASINYNTRVLGRSGYVSVNLVTDREHLAQDKPAGATLLAATSFAPGAQYADFNEKTDKVAEYGLTGLVVGAAGLGAAKLVKVGLLAKFGKVLFALVLAGKKFIVVGLLALGALAKSLLGRKNKGHQAQG